MLNGVLYWPFVNALNFKFVSLEVRSLHTTHSSVPVFNTRVVVTHFPLHPYNTRIHTQNRPVVGSIAGVLWNVYMSSVLHSKSHQELPLEAEAVGREEGATEGRGEEEEGRGEGGWWERWVPAGTIAALPESTGIRFF